MSNRRHTDGFVKRERLVIYKCSVCGDPIEQNEAGRWEHIFEEPPTSGDTECRYPEPILMNIAVPKDFLPVTAKEKFALAYINNDLLSMKDALAEQGGINLNLRAEAVVPKEEGE